MEDDDQVIVEFSKFYFNKNTKVYFFYILL
jgi:hypothetical protein